MVFKLKQTKPFTNFGFQKVSEYEKRQRVNQIFSSVCSHYDTMNDLMSFGIHRLWKRFTVEHSGVCPGHKVLDLAGGTGDLTLKFARLVGATGCVVLADCNIDMLKIGRNRLRDHGIVSSVDYVQTYAENLPFPDYYFDCVAIAFGLRNIADQPMALSEMWRVLKSGGRLLVLEFSKPVSHFLRIACDLYISCYLPFLGKKIAKDRASYQYLVESIKLHPDQQQFKKLIEQAGFDRVDYYNLTGGIAALHCGYKF